MEINFKKYEPIITKVEVNKLEKILDYRYFLKEKEFNKILEEIPKKDIDIKKLEKFLYNLRYIKDENEISSWIYKIKIKSASHKSENLIYCYYWIYLKYYKSNNMESIYNSITKLGKNTFRYMDLKKQDNGFVKSFQKLFYQGKNISFFVFLYEELLKRISLGNFNFFEEYLIDYNSDLGKDLIEKILKENNLKIKNEEIKKNKEFLEELFQKNNKNI